ncbi:hypothetical protein MMC26_003953 [Xylographa opegraphella]|nr:hypothetical protein [Xylographa opegraphella]
MNGVLQSQLDRIENALTTLIDSITSYNPSVPATHELLAADDALTAGLDQLTLHRTNYAHILALQSITTSLDDRLTSTLRTLAQTRADILAAPATEFPSSQRPVPYTEILDYASNISRYAALPGVREKLAVTAQAISTQVDTQQETMQSAQPMAQETNTQQPMQDSTQRTDGTASNTSSFPTPFHPALQSSQEPASSAVPDSYETNKTSIGVLTLTEPERQWLDPLNQATFLPWPNEEVIRRGALAALQARIEQGDDLENDLQGEGMEGVEGVAPSMKVEQNMNGMNGAMKEEENSVVRAGEVQRPRREEVEKPKPSVFASLDLYDPDEE